MHTADPVGKRVRLHGDGSLGQRQAGHLTDEQLVDGPEGEILRTEEEAGELFYCVKLDNVPDESRLLASDCRFVDG